MKTNLLGGDLENISFRASNLKLVGENHLAVKFSSRKENINLF